MSVAVARQYATVTEQPGQLASRLQLEMMAARYAWAQGHCVYKDVLEVACGSGPGLGALSEVARRVEAGDIDRANLEAAARTYASDSKVRIQLLDAQRLPYPDASFDTILLFEAIYYLPDPGRFFAEARRVLRPGGSLLIATVNREWSGFNASPFHVRYYSAAELRERLVAAEFAVDLQAGFPETLGALSQLTSMVRRIAVSLGLLPRTMAGKAFLKRLFYGTLEPIPARLDLRSFPSPRFTAIDAGADLSSLRVIYARASKTH
jgi:SAM-dependent methyltransferase